MICSLHETLSVSDVKWQYLVLAAIFIGAIALSFWTASRVDMHDIEQGLTNVSERRSMRALSKAETSPYTSQSS